MLVFTFGVAVLTLASVAVGQDQDNCECISYFLCDGTIVENDSKCADDFDVCCIVKTTENIDPPLTSSTTAPPQVFAEEPIGSPPRASSCGKRGVKNNEEADLGSNIGWKVFGDDVDTSLGEFPWMVAVMKYDQNGKLNFLCGGSIISPNIILTAAHSVSDFSVGDLQVKAGVWDTVDPAEALSSHQDRSISQMIVHPGFDKKKVIANDFAILVLSQPLTITENVRTVCLPSSEFQLNTVNCVATGWGSDNFGNNSTSTVLKKVDLPLIDYNSCQNQLRQIKKLGGQKFNLHNSFICAGGDKTDTCRGDGGGPLMCPTLDDPNRYVQVGVTSWGVECGQGPPGVYASTQAAAAWIEDNINRNR